MSIPGMWCIGIEVDSPLTVNHRFMKSISSDCDRLMREPNVRSSLFCVCESISAVISTACAWCMIMPCMNSTSFAEFGGNLARVVDGNDLVGWPGAPGWTTTGVGGSGDCAETDSDNKHASAIVAMITPGHERNFRAT